MRKQTAWNARKCKLLLIIGGFQDALHEPSQNQIYVM